MTERKVPSRSGYRALQTESAAQSFDAECDAQIGQVGRAGLGIEGVEIDASSDEAAVTAAPRPTFIGHRDFVGLDPAELSDHQALALGAFHVRLGQPGASLVKQHKVALVEERRVGESTEPLRSCAPPAPVSPRAAATMTATTAEGECRPRRSPERTHDRDSVTPRNCNGTHLGTASERCELGTPTNGPCPSIRPDSPQVNKRRAGFFGQIRTWASCRARYAVGVRDPTPARSWCWAHVRERNEQDRDAQGSYGVTNSSRAAALSS